MMEQPEKKIALGETLPMKVIDVQEVAPKRYMTRLLDDEGDESILFLDVMLPLGDVELRIIHIVGGLRRDN